MEIKIIWKMMYWQTRETNDGKYVQTQLEILHFDQGIVKTGTGIGMQIHRYFLKQVYY